VKAFRILDLKNREIRAKKNKSRLGVHDLRAKGAKGQRAKVFGAFWMLEILGTEAQS